MTLLNFYLQYLANNLGKQNGLQVSTIFRNKLVIINTTNEIKRKINNIIQYHERNFHQISSSKYKLNHYQYQHLNNGLIHCIKIIVGPNYRAAVVDGLTLIYTVNTRMTKKDKEK